MTETVRCRARVRFNSNYGPVRAGDIFWSEPTYAEQMRRRGNVTLVEAADVRPSRRQAFPIAPATKEGAPGKEPAPAEQQPAPPAAPSEGEAPAAGTARPASASPRDRRSRRKT